MIRFKSSVHRNCVETGTKREDARLIPVFSRLLSVLMMLLCVSALHAAGGGDGSDKKQKKVAVAGCFFDDQYGAHGFNYTYPPGSTISISRDVVKQGKVALKFDLVPTAFSGGSICLQDKTLNLQPFINKGALQFWIKGAVGDEKAWVALVDEDTTDKHKTVVRVDISWFGKISTDWSFISIPLKHFGDRGVYWDETEQREIDNDFDWDKVAEFRIEVRKDENKSFTVWVDDIVVTKSIR